MELKNFVDFAFSLNEMDEVKKGDFIIPKEITFKISKKDHQHIQKQIYMEKGMDTSDFKHSEVFEVELYGINFIFEC